MSSINNVTVFGRLGADPIIDVNTNGATGDQFKKARLFIMTSYFQDQVDETTGEVTKKETTQPVPVIVAGKMATVAEKYLKKGDAVLIEGSFDLNEYEDPATGQKKSNSRVKCSRIHLLPNGGKQSPVVELSRFLAMIAKAEGKGVTDLAELKGLLVEALEVAEASEATPPPVAAETAPATV